MAEKAISKKSISLFLERVLLCRLATVDVKGHPHVVPLWYGWDGESLWISAYSSTQKIRHIRQNPYISVVIDSTINHSDNQAVVLEGKAELICAPRDFLEEKFIWIYKRYLGEEGVLAKDPQEWIKDPENLLIKLTPERVMSWGLGEEG